MSRPRTTIKAKVTRPKTDITVCYTVIIASYCFCFGIESTAACKRIWAASVGCMSTIGSFSQWHLASTATNIRFVRLTWLTVYHLTTPVLQNVSIFSHTNYVDSYLIRTVQYKRYNHSICNLCCDPIIQ